MNLKKIRAVSAIGVWASIAYLVIAILYLVYGEPHTHARYMLYGVLLLFPYSVAVAYVASSLNKYHPSQLLMSTGVFLLIFTPILALDYSEEYANLLVVFSGLLGFSSALYTASLKKGSVRLSMELVAVASILMSIIAIARQCWGRNLLFSYYSFSMTIAYPVTLIYAVTVHALPSTFRDHSPRGLPWLLPILTFLSSLMVFDDKLLVSRIFALASIYVYIFAARIYKLKDYFGFAKRFPEGPARSGAYYFLEGHISVLFLTLIISIYTLYPNCNVLCFLHLYALGFSSLHVLIHGPMMLPVILSIRHKRRFNVSPYVFQLLAVLLFPLSGELALGAYILSLISGVLIVV